MSTLSVQKPRERKKTGRPEFEVTPVLRRKVASGAGAGMAHEDIAAALGISRTTLLKHFRDELTVGAYKARLEVIEALRSQAKKGHVAAAKAYLAMEPSLAAPQEIPKPLPAAEPTAPKAKPLGVREQAQIDAETATEADPAWGDVLPRLQRVK